MPMAARVLTPPLRDGDRLSREEFLRRWDAMPDLKRAELIDGIVHMASPISKTHGVFHSRMNVWLGYYMAATPSCTVETGTTWLMSADSAPQPDLVLEISPRHGGQASEEGIYSAGAPELIVEISYTTTARDLGTKLHLYERSGVREYLVVQPAQQKVSWRELADGKYRELPPDPDGWLRSHVFPGLWLDPAALWKGDLASLAAAVAQGIATPEHAAFVQMLAANKR
jgi:Uma2 family endonuclease